MARLEMLLYHALDETGLLQVSTTSSSGPWTDLRLTSTQRVRDALAEWEALAEAAFPGSDFNIAYDAGNAAINFWRLDGDAWFRHTATLQTLLGQDAAVTDNDDEGGAQFAIYDVQEGALVARGAPLDDESGELEEFRAGRVASYHSARAKDVALELYVREDAQTDARLASPLCSGHCAMAVELDNAADYAEGDLDGVMCVYPYGTPKIVRLEGTDDWVRVELETTVQDDPAAAPVAIGTSAWAIYTAAIRFGYKPFYVLEVEGIPYLFTELTDVTLESADYTTAGGTLIIDKGARVGPVLSDKTNVAAANNLEVRLADPVGTSIVAGLMTRPTAITTMTADLAPNGTDIEVVSTRAWSQATDLYFGRSYSTVQARTEQGFEIDTTPWGPGHAYKAGTVIADKPREWGGRRVKLWMMLVTPAGTIMQVAGDDWRDHAVCMFTGFLQSRPVRERALWRLNATDQVRRFAQPLGAGASGVAKWRLDDDAAATIDLEAAVTIRAYHLGASVTALGEYTFQPWLGGTNPMRFSEIRSRLAAGWRTAVAADADFAGASAQLRWDPIWAGDLPATGRRWLAFVDVVAPSTTGEVETQTSITGRVPPLFGSGSAFTVATRGRAQLAVTMRTDVVGAALAVTLEDGDPSALPTSGWVRLTTDGKTEYLEYTNLTVDPVDGSTAILDIRESTSPSLERLAAAEGAEAADVSAEFVWRQDGSAPDVLRRAIVSTGHGENGSWDTLAAGQGYALADIDEDSFDDVFDGAFSTLSFQLGTESDSTLEKLFGGILRLSQRGLATRRSADGSAVQIAAVRVGSADSGVPVATITDADLVATPGARPVRVKGTYVAPQSIAIDCATMPIGDREAADARILTRSPGLLDWTSVRWDLTVHGLDRDALAAPAVAWSTQLYRGAENRQIIEVDVRPDIDAQVGDVVALQSHDAHLWDYALGAAGYSGLARVLGAQATLDGLVQTLLLAVDGIVSSGPFCPSLAVVAVNGTATSPTSIDVAEEHYPLLVRAKNGQATFVLQAYLPGVDGGRGTYTISAVTLTAGVCRLTVSAAAAAPTITLTTAYRLTYPVATACTATQAEHLHNTDVTQWT